ncbi:MAG: D-alanyl-D-alanine carboxypeptidase family protein [Polaromonas sp.]|nr:D-alanyl-D-alanine carboxypeptidase family protein [Polaromonas sp.]
MSYFKITIFLCAFASFSCAYADQYDSICFPLYRAAGAVPGTSECPLVASTADIGMGTYFCTAEPDRINRYCQAAQCSVAPLNPIKGAADSYENGNFSRQPDLGNVSAGAVSGLACIQQRIPGTQITSGYRPQEYQDHLREVWDKRQLLKNNSVAACASTKLAVEKEFAKHRMVHQPGLTSRHSNGMAVDIAGVPEAVADNVASICGMARNVSHDRVHYEPR